MKKILLIILSVAFTCSFSQSKHLIYFKDKGIGPQKTLSKGSAYFQKAAEHLSERSIERRIKNMGENSFITYEDIPVKEDYVNEIKSFGIKIVHKLKWFNAVSAYLNDDQISEIQNLSFVKKVEPVKILKRIEQSENDYSKLLQQNSYQNIFYGPSLPQLELSNIPEVHSKGITGEGVFIGLLDAGFNWQNHESTINTDVVTEYDFVFNDGNTANEEGDPPRQDRHGLIVLSVIGGYKDSSLIGSSFNSSFALAKTENIGSETHIEEDNYARGFEWLDSLGVDITNTSLGYSEFDPGEEDYTYEDLDGETTIVTRASELAFDRGILPVAAAGNEGGFEWFYITAPADGKNTIAVGAVTNENEVTAFSGKGPAFDDRTKPDIVAQGAHVYAASYYSFDGYNFENGTSLASPLATGVAGLLLSAHPHLTNIQLRNILIETAGNSETPDNERGYGLINAADAVSFPNLQKVDNSYILHKIILTDGVDPSTAKIFYSSNGLTYTEDQLSYKGGIYYIYTLPFFNNNRIIDFYFSYSDSAGQSFRFPENNSKNYSLLYGSMNIALYHGIGETPGDYILSQNYPNPFNNTTKINFVTQTQQYAEVIVYDAIGQKVTTLFKGITRSGLNVVTWNGKTDNNFFAASGVYYYTLKLGEELYAKKMILLK